MQRERERETVLERPGQIVRGGKYAERDSESERDEKVDGDFT